MSDPWAFSRRASTPPYPGAKPLPWLFNYMTIRYRGNLRGEEEHGVEIYLLSVLARGISTFIDTHKIIGDPWAMKLCRFVYRRMTRVADWMRLVDDSPESTLGLLKRVQRRIEGLNLPRIQRDTEKLNQLAFEVVIQPRGVQ